MAKKDKGQESERTSKIRRDLIEWFYQHNKKGRSPKGIKDICAAIKTDYGYKSTETKEHLTYLLDLSYVKKEIDKVTIKTGSTVRDQSKVTYRIAAKGIEFMEGKSEFSDLNRYPGINVTATGGSIVVLGDGNVVNAQYQPLYQELDRMRLAVSDTTELNDTSKLEATVHIDTIKNQLALPQPDKTIIQRAWESASKVCTVGTLAGYVATVTDMLKQFL